MDILMIILKNYRAEPKQISHNLHASHFRHWKTSIQIFLVMLVYQYCTFNIKNLFSNAIYMIWFERMMRTDEQNQWLLKNVLKNLPNHFDLIYRYMYQYKSEFITYHNNLLYEMHDAIKYFCQAFSITTVN